MGAIQRLPLTRGNLGVGLLPYGRPEPEDGVYPTANYRIVTPGYFEALDVPVRGRAFTAADRPDRPGVGIVNESAAELLWPGQDAIGQKIQGNEPGDVWFEVVGVVPDVHQHALSQAPRPEVYVPLAQEPQGALSFVLATTGEASALVPAVVEAVRGIDPRLPITRVREMADVVAGSLTEARFMTQLQGLFAALALTLGLIGVYGVMAHAVSERRKEMAIRVALGASGRTLLRTVLADGLRQVTIGVAAGILTALALRKAIASHLFGVEPTDPVTLGGVVALFLVAASVTVCLPALRASRVDPADALRAE